MSSAVLRSTNTFVIRTDLPGGRGTTKLLSKILLKRQKNCQRKALNSLFMATDPFSNKSFCTAVSMMFSPLQSSTLRTQSGRSAVRLACRQKLVSAATASAVPGAVHSVPAPLPSTILIPTWQSCSLAKRQRSTCKNNFYHPHLAFVPKFLHTGQ